MSAPKPSSYEADLKFMRTFGLIKDPSDSLASRVADFFFPSRRVHREALQLLREIRDLQKKIAYHVDCINNR
jgi:hypothetical protein